MQSGNVEAHDIAILVRMRPDEVEAWIAISPTLRATTLTYSYRELLPATVRHAWGTI